MQNTAIIIPTYNHLEDCLKPCLESIAEYTIFGDAAYVIVVANGCVDGTKAYLEELAAKFEWLHYIFAEEQLGYTASVNLGLQYAMNLCDIEKYVMLNNDVILLEHEPDHWIEVLESGFHNETIGITGPVCKNEEFTGLLFCIFFCAMIKAEVVREIGVLDEQFGPGFGEDVDFCMRARIAGYNITQVPLSQRLQFADNKFVGEMPIYHAGTKSFGEYDGYSEIVKRNVGILKRKYNL